MRFLAPLCLFTLGCAFAGWVDLVGILCTVVFLTYCMFLLVTVRPKEEK
jgi:hypothetical protein